jgi:hypothetical protein
MIDRVESRADEEKVKDNEIVGGQGLVDCIYQGCELPATRESYRGLSDNKLTNANVGDE